MGSKRGQLELLDIDPDRFRIWTTKAEVFILKMDQLQRAVTDRTQRTTCQVQAKSQVATGRISIEIGPEDIDDLLPMEHLARREREQLDEAARLAAFPGGALDLTTIDDDTELAKQMDHDPWRTIDGVGQRSRIDGRWRDRIHRQPGFQIRRDSVLTRFDTRNEQHQYTHCPATSFSICAINTPPPVHRRRGGTLAPRR